MSNIIITWKDYLEKCIHLEYDLSNEFILFPKNLKERHDEICLEFDKHKMEIYNKKFIRDMKSFLNYIIGNIKII